MSHFDGLQGIRRDVYLGEPLIVIAWDEKQKKNKKKFFRETERCKVNTSFRP